MGDKEKTTCIAVNAFRSDKLTWVLLYMGQIQMHVLAAVPVQQAMEPMDKAWQDQTNATMIENLTRDGKHGHTHTWMKN